MWSKTSFLGFERITMRNWHWISLFLYFEPFYVLRSKHPSKLFTVEYILGERKWLCFLSVFSEERRFCFSFCSSPRLNCIQPFWHLAHFCLYIFDDRMIVGFCLKGNIELIIKPVSCRSLCEILLSIGLDTQWLMMLTKKVWIICIECEGSGFITFIYTIEFCITVFYTPWAH